MRLLNDAERNEKLTLLRYLRARDGDVGKAAAMMEATAKFREVFRLDEADLGGWRPPEALLSGGHPGGPDGLQRWRSCPPSRGYFTRDGSPIVYNRIGQIDPESLLRSVHMYDLLVRDALTLESVLGSAAAAARRTGGPVVFKVVVVQDLAGLGRKHMYSLGFKALGEMAKVAADHYPETLKACYLINAPAIFSLIWKLVQHMFDPNVRQKARARTGHPRRSRRPRTCCH